MIANQHDFGSSSALHQGHVLSTYFVLLFLRAGHSKGVQSVQFFPGTGHLLLSGSMDTKVKVWDVYESRQVRA